MADAEYGEDDLGEWNDAVIAATEQGRLMALLNSVPRSRWNMPGFANRTVLHLACRGGEVAAVKALLAHGLAVNARAIGNTPAHIAAYSGQPRVLELLCAAGADVTLRLANYSPLDYAIRESMRAPFEECARVLLANGVRLSSVRESYQPFDLLDLRAFERGVLRCRAAVVALLRVKRAGNLLRWDKYLLTELAVCVWSTRYDKGWREC